MIPGWFIDQVISEAYMKARNNEFWSWVKVYEQWWKVFSPW